MSKFLVETHCHTSESSGCGRFCAADAVEVHISEGYNGMIITDHFIFSEPNTLSRREYNKKAAQLALGYENASKAANGRIAVFRGVEIRLPGSFNDYLVYGVDDSFIYGNPDIRNMNIAQFSELCRAHGLPLIQAHPFRNGIDIVKPSLLDGIEVFNGNVRQESRNDISAAWAEKFGLRRTSGSDFHEIEDLARGGILLDEPAADTKQLISLIMDEKYSLMSRKD